MAKHEASNRTAALLIFKIKSLLLFLDKYWTQGYWVPVLRIWVSILHFQNKIFRQLLRVFYLLYAIYTYFLYLLLTWNTILVIALSLSSKCTFLNAFVSKEKAVPPVSYVTFMSYQKMQAEFPLKPVEKARFTSLLDEGWI